MEESILTAEQLAELNPEGIEINTVVEDLTSQDTFNTDSIEQLNDGEFEAENIEEAIVEDSEEATEEVVETEEVEETAETTEEVEEVEVEEEPITETEGE